MLLLLLLLLLLRLLLLSVIDPQLVVAPWLIVSQALIWLRACDRPSSADMPSAGLEWSKALASSGHRAALALEAGHVEYKKGDLVEYYSSWHKEWMNVIVLQADDEGRLKLAAEPGCSNFELKPNTWLAKSSVDTKIRPRSKPDAAVDSACADIPLGGTAAGSFIPESVPVVPAASGDLLGDGPRQQPRQESDLGGGTVPHEKCVHPGCGFCAHSDAEFDGHCCGCCRLWLMKHRRKKPQHGVRCEEKLFTSLPSRGDDTFLPEDWPTLAEVLAAAEMTWGTFDKESVRWKRCTKIQALYEAAVLEATGKDDESQVARLRLLLEQIMSLTGLGPPSSSGATSETAGGATGVSLGEAQPSQGDHGRSERVPPGWLAPTAKWAAAPAGKTAPRRSAPSEPQDKRRRRLADPPPELGHCANPRVFPRPRSLQPSDTAAGRGKDAPAGDETSEGFWQSAL